MVDKKTRVAVDPRVELASVVQLYAPWINEKEMIMFIATKKGGLSEGEKEYAFQVATGPRLVTTLRARVEKYKEAMRETRDYTSFTSLFASTFGIPYRTGNILFRKEFKGMLPEINSFNYGEGTLPIVIVDTGGEPGVRPPVEKGFRVQEICPIGDDISNALSKIAITGREYIIDGELELLGKLISITHNLVASLGEVSESTDELARLLNKKEHGVLGARTIGYGREGAVIALYQEDKKDHLKSIIQKPARVLLDELSLNVPGVKIE